VHELVQEGLSGGLYSIVGKERKGERCCLCVVDLKLAPGGEETAGYVLFAWKERGGKRGSISYTLLGD